MVRLGISKTTGGVLGMQWLVQLQNEGQLVNTQHGNKSSRLTDVYRNQRLVWSNSTEVLLQNTFLVVIEMCQSTHSITACCIWVAQLETGQSVHVGLKIHTVGTRTGPPINRRSWYSLMIHILYVMWAAGWTCLTSSGLVGVWGFSGVCGGLGGILML